MPRMKWTELTVEGRQANPDDLDHPGLLFRGEPAPENVREVFKIFAARGRRLRKFPVSKVVALSVEQGAWLRKQANANAAIRDLIDAAILGIDTSDTFDT